jgi:hypothetical protein
VLINSGTGAMSEESSLSPARGGLGINITLDSSMAGFVAQVNAGGTAFQLAAAPESPGSKLYIYNRFI